jgi:iron complex outermembrane receptor protein
VRPYPPLLPIANAAGFPRNLKVGFTSVDPKVSVNYKLTDDIFAYASFTTGFKSGGFNYGSVGDPFLPENIEAYEAGLKTSWFDNRLIANFSLFRYDYSNIQTQVQFFTPVTSLVVLNAAGARNQGVEVEITAAPTRGLRLDASLSLLDAEYTEFVTGDGSRPALGLLDLKGFTIPQSPDYMINLGAAYTLPIGDGDLTLRGEYRRTGRTYYTPFNIARDSQAPYDMANAFLTYDSVHWTAGLWVRNLTDKFVKQGLSLGSGLLGGGGGYSTGSIAPPRTYGVTFGVKF